MLEMVSNANLRNFSVDEPIHIYTDASGLYWGGVLTQNGLPLCFTSGKFSKSQLNWTILDKEAFAVIGTVKRHGYLTDNNRATVTVYTDHKNLQYLLNPDKNILKSSTLSRVSRWSLLIQSTNIIVEVISGESNHFADLLSRWGYPKISQVRRAYPSATNPSRGWTIEEKNMF